MRNIGKKQRIAACVIIVIVVLLMVLVAIRDSGKKNLQKDITAEHIISKIETTEMTETTEEIEEIIEEKKEMIIEYDGKQYKYRDNLVNILCIGVDKEEVMWERDDDGGSVGQADAIMLVSLDLNQNDIRIVAIPRDTMVDIIACDENGNEMGAFFGQIALQYAYADGQQKSCSLVIGQIADIFQRQVPINGYVAMNLSCISVVNDAVGGVTVVMDDDYTLFNPKFTKGAEIHLQGEEALDFVQKRNIYVSGSAFSRIVRQKQYLRAFISQTKAALKKNPALAVDIMKELSDYMLTDISVDEVLYLSTEILDCNYSDENMQILQGEIRMGEKYEEYYIDQDALQQTILQLFYEEQE